MNPEPASPVPPSDACLAIDVRTAAIWLSVAVAMTTGIVWCGEAGVVPAAGAVLAVYGFGHVSGALLVDPRRDRASVPLALVRLLAGLLLTSVAFLLALLLGLPWHLGPAAVLVAAVGLHGRAAFPPPRLRAPRLDEVVAVALAAVVLAPPVISSLEMAPGAFAPVFFNVDFPYFVEKVHSLVAADSYPPESLSVAGGQRSYHFGGHAMAAVIVRASGLLPHHAVFLVLVPLLAAGLLAAACLLARRLSPAVPAWLTVPLLVVPAPTLWYDGWAAVWPRLVDAVSTGDLGPLNTAAENWELWGVTPNVQNVAAHFLVLAALAGVAAATSEGWRLPVFLIGTAVMVKSPAAVALASGFSLAQAWRAVDGRSVRPLVPALVAAALFGVTFGAFWILPAVPAEMRTVFQPGFLIEYLRGRETAGWFAADVLWLLLPALIAWMAAVTLRRAGRDAVPLLLFAVAPIVVLNVLRTVDLRRGYGVSGMNEDDWRQVVMPVPVFLHAFVLSVLGPRWMSAGRLVRGLVAGVLLMSVLPVALVAVRYAQVVVSKPDNAHEFADNRAIGAALAAVPVSGTLVVTNDLRYPADGFRRENRQMQIPALFGHQAFAVNYFYEAYPFSRTRQELQALLEADVWSGEIDAAAREHGWTHLLIRKDYPHPRPIPLERVFDGDEYAVYRFPD
ncbi:MAG: hypothetical protein FJW23_15325 [Acidimicrobiia bacterium]|nr:hypothetical protein [Acidimicrobiia bacterium]